MVQEGRWRALRPEVTRHRGYRISALVSPLANVTWARLAEEYRAVKDDPDRYRVFLNTNLALPYSEEGGAMDENALAARAESFSASMRSRRTWSGSRSAVTAKMTARGGYRRLVSERHLLRAVLTRSSMAGSTMISPGASWTTCCARAGGIQAAGNCGSPRFALMPRWRAFGSVLAFADLARAAASWPSRLSPVLRAGRSRPANRR